MSLWRKQDIPLSWNDTEAIMSAITRRAEWLRNAGASVDVARDFAAFNVLRARDAAVDGLRSGGWQSEAAGLAACIEPSQILATVLRIERPVVSAASKAVRKMKKGGAALDRASLTGAVALALNASGGAADLLGEPYSDAASSGVCAAFATKASAYARFFATPSTERDVDVSSNSQDCQDQELAAQTTWLATQIAG
jgi:hypothetical protein